MQRNQTEKAAPTPYPARAGRKWSTIPRSYLYPSYFKLQVRWLRYSAHFMGLAPSGPLQAAFKSAYANLSLTPVTYLCKRLGMK